MFDLDYLASMADPYEIAEAIGLETKRKGKNIYCECPSHRKALGKSDSNIGNCVLTPHGYHCFACNTSGNVFNMVMDYCNLSFGQAVKKVASITGGNFEISNMHGEHTVKKQPFSTEDLELIGLSSLANPKGDAGREVIGVFNTRPESGVYFRRGDEYVIYSSVKRITLNQLFQEDENIYYKLIADNAKLSLDKYKSLYDSFRDRGCLEFEAVYNLLSEDGMIDSRVLSELKNVILLNIRRIERILKEALAHC